MGPSTLTLMNARGDTMVLWAAAPGGQSEYALRVRGAFRPAGGEFGPEEEIEPAEPELSGVYRWDGAIAPDGDVLLGWEGYGQVHFARRPAGGRFGRATTLHDRRDRIGTVSPTVAIDRQGAGLLAWVETGRPEGGSDPYATLPPVLRAARVGPDGKLGARELVTAHEHVYSPSVAFDTLGNALAVYNRGKAGEGVYAVDYDVRVPSIGDLDVERDAVDLRASEPARVRVEFHRLAGRRASSLGALKRRVLRGSNTLPLTSKLATRLAAAGRYRATVTARDAAGRRAKTRRVSFTR